MPRWGSVIALVVLALFGIGGAATSFAAETEKCTDGSPLVCLSISDNPEVVPPSAAGSPRYVSYSATVTNRARSAITHVTASATFSPGLTLVSATSSVGSCTTAGGQLGCTIGKLARNTSATVTAVAKSPQAEGTATASFEFSFDEVANDAPTPDPKQDSVSDDEDTTVDARAGTAASFVPQGASVNLSTDPTNTGVATAADPLIGRAVITTSPTAVLALVEEVAAPVSCPKRVICRGGDWLHADIPGTFDPPLAFSFRWDSSISPSNLNAKKFAVLYTECLEGCPVQVISKRCSSANPAAAELPCLTAVAKLSDGDWIATLLNSHNGHMR